MLRGWALVLGITTVPRTSPLEAARPLAWVGTRIGMAAAVRSIRLLIRWVVIIGTRSSSSRVLSIIISRFLGGTVASTSFLMMVAATIGCRLVK